MSRIVAILDDTPASQRLGLAFLSAIGDRVSAVGFTLVEDLPAVADAKTLYCPLTLDLPPKFQFWGRSIWQFCRDLDRLRDRAMAIVLGAGFANDGVKVGAGGKLYLPIVWQVNHPIYERIIADDGDGNYRIADNADDALQSFASRLLEQIAAPTAVYLLQFDRVDNDIIFDRLFPFPAAPALATIDTMRSNLFIHYWQCILQSRIQLETNPKD